MKTTDYLILLVCHYNTGFANYSSSRTVRDTFRTSFPDEIETSIDKSFKDITERMSILATDVARDKGDETEAIVLRRQKDARKKVLDAVWNGSDGKRGFECFSATVRFDTDPSYDPYECGIAGIPESLDIYVSAEKGCGKEKKDFDKKNEKPKTENPKVDFSVMEDFVRKDAPEDAKRYYDICNAIVGAGVVYPLSADADAIVDAMTAYAFRNMTDRGWDYLIDHAIDGTVMSVLKSKRKQYGKPTDSAAKASTDEVVDSIDRLLKALGNETLDKIPCDSLNRMVLDIVSAITTKMKASADPQAKD